MGQGNTNVSHFVVQRADLIGTRAYFPCGPRRPLIYGGAENCLLLIINPDCRTPAAVSLFD